ncbi:MULTISPECIES: Type 1 glutamine amidotransferase-like domain-containing protein [Paenibacillus]|jgi:cyanophycinase|uniref:Cyanophycinase n=1 Tax=Paenibacillus odorifer TaxID=189426 RepID=A0A1R0WSG0_9BACL|nr:MULTISPECIES: Type 1 glutamine amidotransferase-like domain-containing protein [Paenibacillus]OMD10416.1 cyanophycinase [Paenibacillus odorifer]OMD20401.1 cyanophycinase [Paenibacillus odorifer]OMD22146.1 cyanophycinase [Paenibacillus odorifer]OME26716.1 cyanophycinase [Paenibacillus odorifer]OME37187.1 cyanophycinase [Paenibacillus odorifer]
MKTHYYLDWFYDKGFSEKLVNVLHEDITDRKSLVMISAESSDFSDEQVNIDSVFERTWFNQANIYFDEYHFIDDRTQKEDAQRLIQNASVVFLCGGTARNQKHLLTEYELSDLIKKSNAVVMGTSAGGMNMSDEYVDECTVCEGMALNHFSFEAHFDHDNTAMIEERFPLSNKMDIYVAADKDGAVRVKGSKIDIIGNVYLISHSKIQKLAETL